MTRLHPLYQEKLKTETEPILQERGLTTRVAR